MSGNRKDTKVSSADTKAGGSHKNYKIVVFGSGAVGKSSITLRFVSNTFTQEYLPTIEDCYRKTLSVDNQITSLDILDTAGQEDFSALRDQWVREGNAFVLVYAINSAQSFRDLNAFRERILLVNDEREVNAPIVLVGNKADLSDTERKVTVEEAGAMAAEWGNIPYFECSALTGAGCEVPFHAAIRAVRKIDAAKPKPSTSSGGGFWSMCTIL